MQRYRRSKEKKAFAGGINLYFDESFDRLIDIELLKNDYEDYYILPCSREGLYLLRKLWGISSTKKNL